LVVLMMVHSSKVRWSGEGGPASSHAVDFGLAHPL
jgi:hypothetical protein